MNAREARIVGAIACTADGECSSCAAALIRQLAEKFPDQRVFFVEAFEKEFGFPPDTEKE